MAMMYELSKRVTYEDLLNWNGNRGMDVVCHWNNTGHLGITDESWGIRRCTSGNGEQGRLR